MPKTNINLTERHFSHFLFWQTRRTIHVQSKHIRKGLPLWDKLVNRCQNLYGLLMPNRQMSKSTNEFSKSILCHFWTLYEKLMLSFFSCKCNPFSYWNVISPSNRRFTFWNRLKFFNPNLINFNMIFPSWVRLGFELNSKLNVFTVKEEIHWLNTQSWKETFVK